VPLLVWLAFTAVPRIVVSIRFQYILGRSGEAERDRVHDIRKIQISNFSPNISGGFWRGVGLQNRILGVKGLTAQVDWLGRGERSRIFEFTIFKNAVARGEWRWTKIHFNSDFHLPGWSWSEAFHRQNAKYPSALNFVVCGKVIGCDMRPVSDSLGLGLQGELAGGDASIDRSGNESSDCADKRTDFNNCFPPRPSFMAAVAGFFSSGWGWWNQRDRRRENLFTTVFLLGIGLWVYVVHGFLWWETSRIFIRRKLYALLLRFSSWDYLLWLVLLTFTSSHFTGFVSSSLCTIPSNL
jgi:hypothetical protein